MSDLPTLPTSNTDDLILSNNYYEIHSNSDVDDVDSDLSVNEESELDQHSDIPLLDAGNDTLISTECDGTYYSSGVEYNSSD